MIFLLYTGTYALIYVLIYWSRAGQEEDEEHSRDLDNSDRFSRRVFLPNLEKGFV